MTSTKKCGHCGTRVPVETEHCPNCPASFPIEGGGVPSRRPRYGPLPTPVLGLLLLAAFLFGAWRLVNFVMTYADSEARGNPLTRMTHSLEAQGLSLTKDGAPPEPDGPMQAPAFDGSGPEGATSAQLVASQAGAAAASREMVALEITHENDPPVRRRAKKTAPATEWRLRGTVYDLVTLYPVPEVHMTLKDAQTARNIETITDARGRYRLTVPALSGRGYSVVFVSPKYASSYLNPDAQNVAEKPEEERLKMAYDLSHAFDPPYPVQGYSREPITTNFYLAPREARPQGLAPR